MVELSVAVAGLWVREVTESSIILSTVLLIAQKKGLPLGKPVLIGVTAGVITAVFLSLGLFWVWQQMKHALVSSLPWLILIFSTISIGLFLAVTTWSFHENYWQGWLKRWRHHSLIGTGGFILGLAVVTREGFELSMAMSIVGWQSNWAVVQKGMLWGIGTCLVLIAVAVGCPRWFSKRYLLITTGVLMAAVTLLFIGMTISFYQQISWLPFTPLGTLAWQQSIWCQVVGFPRSMEALLAMGIIVIYWIIANRMRLGHFFKNALFPIQYQPPQP